ncbi:hypothetical protein GGTG_04763 [Gaeumannomyces tritici R3-111a-1]|uniref:PD-(D/E)XK nuclease-like domain-containing protein n=1 Tax=Gaeumannomyces tritici (strain R3-111a-1) TaxID=644352 RepID=J3NU14_GAET3|nr:hypothetical protein GGTG_04763 [Gaeumannomyces tritici R3-111a-1]EJT79679.1 hypothetical protein GGTG_04763 [Gaeumannomyces tritici R3-111a-1]
MAQCTQPTSMHHAVLRWLNELPDCADVDAQADPSRDLHKRRRTDQDEDQQHSQRDGSAKRRRGPCGTNLRTPPQSRSVSGPLWAERQMDHDQDNNAHREATTPPDADPSSHGAVATDDTPRASLADRPRHRQVVRHMSASRSSRRGSSASSVGRESSGNRSEATGSSGRPSAVAGAKRKRTMELAPDQVRIEDLDTGLAGMVPPRLRELEAAFRKSRHEGFVSSSRRAEMQAAGVPDMFEAGFFTAPLDHQGRLETQESPSLVDVLALWTKAKKCFLSGWDEAGWNMAVHYPLLCLALPDGGQLEVTPCTTASIQPRFVLPPVSPSRVDFCIAVNPHWPNHHLVKTPASRAVAEVCWDLPGQSINHTNNYKPLASRPIAISIETKRRGGSDEDAVTQLGIWQAAQWEMLQELVQPRHDSTSSLATGPAATGPADPFAPPSKQPTYLALHGLDFLPAIYIVGHDWKFAALTRDAVAPDALPRIRSQSTLWTGCTIGSTSSVEGIYRIIWCLRRLARYSVEEFWPWYQQHVLELDIGT